MLLSVAREEATRFCVRGCAIRAWQGHHVELDWTRLYGNPVGANRPYMLYHFTKSVALARRIKKDGLRKGSRRHFYFRGDPGAAQTTKYRAVVCVRTAGLDGNALYLCQVTDSYLLECQHVPPRHIAKLWTL